MLFNAFLGKKRNTSLFTNFMDYHLETYYNFLFYNILKNKNFIGEKDVIFNRFKNIKKINEPLWQRMKKEGFGRNSQENMGGTLEEIFRKTINIVGKKNKYKIIYLSYSLKDSSVSPHDCKLQGISYVYHLYIKCKVITYREDKEKNEIIPQEIIKTIYCGTIPRMLSNGSFIVNGIPKLFVTQLQRIPGCFLIGDKKLEKKTDEDQYIVKISPYIGSWMELFMDYKKITYFKIDKKKRLHVTTLLMAIEQIKYDKVCYKEDIIKKYYDTYTVNFDDKGYALVKVYYMDYINYSFTHDVLDEKNQILIHKNHTLGNILKIEDNNENPHIWAKLHGEDINGKFYMGKHVIHGKTKEILLEIGHIITHKTLSDALRKGMNTMVFVDYDAKKNHPYILKTLGDDPVENSKEAIQVVAQRINQNKVYSLSSPLEVIENTFFNGEYYNFTELGRKVMNERLGINVDPSITILTYEDIYGAVNHLFNAINHNYPHDDLDSLSNKRVRNMGENMYNQIAIGAKKMVKNCTDRLSLNDSLTEKLYDILNGTILLYPLKRMLNVSSLSQFMEANNPISSIVHGRRLNFTAILGDSQGGSKKSDNRRTTAAREVHSSYAGRICLVQTPEGMQIGYVHYLSMYAKANEYGFLVAPFYRVKKGLVDYSQAVYLTYEEESERVISNQEECFGSYDNDGKITKEYVLGKQHDNLTTFHRDDIEYVDCAPDQIFSLSAGLIPLINSNDPFRALIAANMQKQVVPTINKEPPLIKTGVEEIFTMYNNETVIRSYHEGRVKSVDKNHILIIDSKDNSPHFYFFPHLQSSNQSTPLSFIPRVKIGDLIKVNQVICDSVISHGGELAMGNNALVAFLTCAKCYEDSIQVSRKYAIEEGKLTSLTIKEIDVHVRSYINGDEHLTRDLPKVHEKYLEHLDINGIVKPGTHVKSGMILVGKVKPMKSTNKSEEKLLGLLFEDKGSMFQNVSFKVPAGIDGIVTDVKLLQRTGYKKNDEYYTNKIDKLRDLLKECKVLEDRNQSMSSCGKLSSSEKTNLKIELDRILDKIHEYTKKLENLGIYVKISPTREIINVQYNKEGPLNIEYLQLNKLETQFKKNINKLIDTLGELTQLPREECEIIIFNKKNVKYTNDLYEKYHGKYKELFQEYKNRENDLKKGLDLQNGILQTVKILIAIPCKAQLGDKLCGRHSNKGTISAITPGADMIHLKDGTPVDIVLNSMGVIARMNIAQMLETHGGMACMAISLKLRRWLRKNNNNFQDKELLEFVTKLTGLNLNTLTPEERENLFVNIAKSYSLVILPFQNNVIKHMEELLELGDLDPSGLQEVYDGTTGEKVGNLCVGYQYILKLCHMAKDKIHSRSTGPYSLLTQQPLSGRSNDGGLRFGEMESWAIQAYGAAYTLEELMGVHSDMMKGRYSAFKALINGNKFYKSHEIGASNSMFVNIIRAMSMNLDFQKTVDEDEEINGYILMDKDKESEDNGEKLDGDQGQNKQEIQPQDHPLDFKEEIKNKSDQEDIINPQD